MVDGKDFRLADEIRHIQRRAARQDGRIVTVGQLILFSTETGDAWLLDKEDGFAAPLTRDGDPEVVHIEDQLALRRGRVRFHDAGTGGRSAQSSHYRQRRPVDRARQDRNFASCMGCNAASGGRIGQAP